MKSAFGLIIASALASFAVPVAATTIIYNFKGPVNMVFGNPFYGIAPIVGNYVVGTVSYDTAVPDTDPAPSIGRYEQPGTMTLSFTLLDVTFQNEGSYNIVVNRNSSYDNITFYDNSPKFGGELPPAISSSIEFYLTDFSASAFSGDGLPSSLNLADFSSRTGIINALSGGLASGVVFSINSLTPVLVPEPGTTGLLVIGLLVGAFTMRRRRS